MEVENELKALRYLINDLILYVYDLRIKMDEISKSPRRYKTREPNADGSSIGFDFFNISKEKYNMFVNRFGIDIVNKACVKLDEFVKINEYIPYGNSHRALEKYCKEIVGGEDDTKGQKEINE